MKFVGKAVLKAAETIGIQLEIVDPEVASGFRSDIDRRYAKKGMIPLWERLVDSIGDYDPEGWRVIGDYVGDREAMLFFDEDNEPTVFRIRSGDLLISLLSEAPLFVFYIANQSGEYLLCHNDHDYLIACGDAMTWLKERKKAREAKR